MLIAWRALYSNFVFSSARIILQMKSVFLQFEWIHVRFLIWSKICYFTRRIFLCLNKLEFAKNRILVKRSHLKRFWNDQIQKKRRKKNSKWKIWYLRFGAANSNSVSGRMFVKWLCHPIPIDPVLMLFPLCNCKVEYSAYCLTQIQPKRASHF